jgi:histidine decarboxylase
MISPHEALSSHESYCGGYGNPGSFGRGYFLGMSLTIGSARQELSPGLDKILAFDSAEIQQAHLGETNMITVSSFVGPDGLIWGHDVVRPDDAQTPHVLDSSGTIFSYEKQTPLVHSARPLSVATKALFGSVDNRNFPLLPGTHILCATKSYTEVGPTHLYSAIAIGIPPNRDTQACLLMEDVGAFSSKELSKVEITTYESQLLHHLVESVLKVGENQRIEYREILIDITSKPIQKGDVGCALVAAPYFTLAQNANVQEHGRTIVDMSLSEWQQATSR